MFLPILTEGVLEVVHSIELAAVESEVGVSVRNIDGFIDALVEVDRLGVVPEVEVILIYLQFLYITRQQRLLFVFLCDVPPSVAMQINSSRFVRPRQLLAPSPSKPLVVVVEQSQIAGYVLSFSASLHEHDRPFVFIGLFDLHLVLFIAIATVLLHHPRLLHLVHDVFVVVSVFDVDLDAVFVVGARKHQFS